MQRRPLLVIGQAVVDHQLKVGLKVVDCLVGVTFNLFVHRWEVHRMYNTVKIVRNLEKPRLLGGVWATGCATNECNFIPKCLGFQNWKVSKETSIYEIHMEGQGLVSCGRMQTSTQKIRAHCHHPVFFSCKEVGIFYTRNSSLNRIKSGIFSSI